MRTYGVKWENARACREDEERIRARRGKGSVNGNGERHDNVKADEDGTADGEMEEERTRFMVWKQERASRCVGAREKVGRCKDDIMCDEKDSTHWTSTRTRTFPPTSSMRPETRNPYRPA